jgi:hypothetical protein
MKKRNEDVPDNLGGLGGMLPAEVLKLVNELLEYVHQSDHQNEGSNNTFIYVAPGAQYVKNLYQQQQPLPDTPQRKTADAVGKDPLACIRQSITQLMAERYGDEPLFNLQAHWQAIYRTLVDKGYCRDSDFDGFDTFIRKVMPEKVNKPYTKASVKQISQTDFVKPFPKWTFDLDVSKTRKPFERMVAVAKRFLEILEENGL